MRGLGILILVVLFIWLVWPSIARWLKRKAMERAEDYMRSSMGMPPRDKSGKTKSSRTYQDSQSYGYRERRNPYGARQRSSGPIIPKEYAEDVEFIETKDYSKTSFETTGDAASETYHESQISDAEWTEIKKPAAK